MKTYWTFVAALLLVLGLAVQADEHAHGHEHDHGHEHGSSRSVEVSDSAARSMGLRTVRAVRRRMRSTRVLNGRLELSPDARRTTSAPVAGRLSLKVKPLQDVAKGDVLFTLASPGLKEQDREIQVLEARLQVYRQLKSANAELEAQLKIKRAAREAMLEGAEVRDGAVVVRAASAGVVDVLDRKSVV